MKIKILYLLNDAFRILMYGIRYIFLVFKDYVVKYIIINGKNGNDKKRTNCE